MVLSIWLTLIKITKATGRKLMSSASWLCCRLIDTLARCLLAPVTVSNGWLTLSWREKSTGVLRNIRLIYLWNGDDYPVKDVKYGLDMSRMHKSVVTSTFMLCLYCETDTVCSYRSQGRLQCHKLSSDKEIFQIKI